MATVCLADDLKHNRKVALYVRLIYYFSRVVNSRSNPWRCTVQSTRIFGRFLALTVALTASACGGAEVTIYVQPEGGGEAAAPQVAFAAHEIEAALAARGARTTVRIPESPAMRSDGPRIVLATTEDEIVQQALVDARGQTPVSLKNEGFVVFRTGVGDAQTIWVLGEGVGGVMYGGLEVAEQIRLRGIAQVESMERSPYMQMRGTKFNIPLDVRTPSYSDMSNSAQENIATVWDFDFWTHYLDTLARYRYNFVSLWSLHPFPSMVKVPDYPDIALDDVLRSTIEFQEDYSTSGAYEVTPEMLANVQVVKQITIDEKIEFWRRVIRYAKDRNIDFYVVTWNIFPYGTNGKYGITDDINNPATIDYFRKSVEQLLLTYPLLAGLGLTTGENMGAASFQAKEDWAMATYGQGALDVAREQPERALRFIHRQHQTRAQDIARTFQPLDQQPNVDFVFSFKYAQAHVMSSTTQTFHREFVENLGDLKTIWTLRNDDAYLFRWGAPDFVREFVSNIPYDVTQGFYYGSDQWIWAREFLSLEPKSPRQLEIVKHWYDWMLWGRIGYDPTLGNERLIAILGEKFPRAPARELFDAWQNASMIYPLTTGFHWGALDYQWYIEACLSRSRPAQTASGFHDVNRFITLGVHPGTDNIAIPRYAAAVVAGENPEGTTPVQVSERPHERADAALAALKRIRADDDDELRRTLADIQAMALLGKYYAHKIRGATELALFRMTGERTWQAAAVNELIRAAEIWERYTTLAAAHYKNPVWMNRVGNVDWEELRGEVGRDIEIARRGTVEIRSPEHGERFEEGEAVILTAEPVAYQGETVRGVDFLVDGFVVGSATVPPYGFEWEAAGIGRHVLEARITDSRGQTEESENVEVYVGAYGLTIARSEDDAEERSDGSVDLDGNELLIGEADSGPRIVGLRFAEVPVPRGEEIRRAYIQFSADGFDDEVTELSIRAELAGNAAAFANRERDLSSRSRTVATVTWSPPPWFSGSERSDRERTPDLSALIQEVITRPDWREGSALIFIIEGTGERDALSYDGGGARASPTLYIELGERRKP